MTDSNIIDTYCCKEIGKSTIIQNYFNENQNTLEFVYDYGFKVSEIPLDIILSDPLLKRINEKHTIKSGGIIRLDPHRCYNWHVDTSRGVCVNLLLTPYSKSMVLFGRKSEDSEEQLDIIEFKYKPETLYWFNNQVLHTIINFQEPRYLFSVIFQAEKDLLNFDSVKNDQDLILNSSDQQK